MNGDEKFVVWATFGLVLLNVYVTLRLAAELQKAKGDVDKITGAVKSSPLGGVFEAMGW